ncbi:hypothetical protein MJH12_06330, partial [bacterium]|nr:hypothetical protein [bacterium]
TLDFEKERLGVDVGQGVLRLDQFISLQGSFAFDKGATYLVDIKTGLGDLAKLGDGVIDAIGLSQLLADMGLGESNFSKFEDIAVSTMSIGGSNIQAFAGVGGPYKQDFNWDEDSDGDGNPYNDYYVDPEALGLAIDDVDFGMIIMDTQTPFLDQILDQFIAAKLTAGFVGMVGVGEDINNNGVIDNYIPQDLNANGVRDEGEAEFTIISEDRNGNGTLDAMASFQGRDISFDYNTGPKWGGVLGPATVDFKSSFSDFTEDTNGNGVLDAGEDLNHDGLIDTAVFAINTGGDPVYLDYQDAILKVDVGFAELKIADFLTLQGGFSFSQLTNQEVVVDTGDLGELIEPLASGVGLDPSQIKLDVDMLTISATNVYGFAGIGGSRSHDTNGDGIVDYQDALDDSAVGLYIQNANLAVALST